MDTLEEAPTTSTTATSKRSGAARRRLKKQREAAALEARIAQLTLAAETPARLPPELIYRIIELGGTWSGRRFANGTFDDAERLSFLCTASLVCSLWRKEAQKLLWQAVTLQSNRDLESFLLSEGKWTILLSIQPASGGDDRNTMPLKSELVKKAIQATNGLRFLYVGDLPRGCRIELDPSVFASDSLSDLEFLILYPSVVYGRSSRKSLRHLPFALEDLGLHFVWSSGSTFFPWELAPALLNNMLLTAVTLQFGVDDSSAAVTRARNAAFRAGAIPNVSALFKPNTINTLRLICQALVGEPCWGGILAYIKQCRTLRELRTDSAIADLLLALPNPLHTLAVVRATVFEYDTVLEGLRAGWPGLSQLQAFEVESETEATDQGLSVEELRRSWEALSEECRRRGIALRRNAPCSS